jgi:hypothetical protein
MTPVLDEAEQSARSGVEDEGLDPAESVDFLRNLPALREEAPNSRRALAESLFESVDVLGLDTMPVEPTPAAVRRGLAEAFRADELVMVGARGVEPACPTCRIAVPSWIEDALIAMASGWRGDALAPSRRSGAGARA